MIDRLPKEIQLLIFEFYSTIDQDLILLFNFFLVNIELHNNIYDNYLWFNIYKKIHNNKLYNNNINYLEEIKNLYITNNKSFNNITSNIEYYITSEIQRAIDGLKSLNSIKQLMQIETYILFLEQSPDKQILNSINNQLINIFSKTFKYKWNAYFWSNECDSILLRVNVNLWNETYELLEDNLIDSILKFPNSDLSFVTFRIKWYFRSYSLLSEIIHSIQYKIDDCIYQILKQKSSDNNLGICSKSNSCYIYVHEEHFLHYLKYYPI